MIQSSSMFWRLWWRAISVRRSQAALALASLIVGAAITSMLLNLYSDVRRKMTEDFRAYGANVVIAPGSGAGAAMSDSRLLGQSAVQPVVQFARQAPNVQFAPVLYGVVRVSPTATEGRSMEFANAVAVGAELGVLRRLNPGWHATGVADPPAGPGQCAVGANLAARWHLQPGNLITLARISAGTEDPGETDDTCRSAAPLCGKGSPPRAGQAPVTTPAPPARPLRNQEGSFGGAISARRVLNSSAIAPDFAQYRVATILTTGASEDDQVFIPLASLQSLLGLRNKITLVELSIPGDTRDVETAVQRLARDLPGLDVRPIRQIVYSEGRVLGTIRWLLLSLTVLILVIIALCVMATMTAIVLERRRDIGIMKALGAADAVVMRLFMTEGAGLGLVSGVLGYAVGVLLARGLAERLFGVSLHLNAWTLPLVCSLSVALAVVSALLPVRIVRAIQPTLVLKGE